jgi:hypothetical protein
MLFSRESVGKLQKVVPSLISRGRGGIKIPTPSVSQVGLGGGGNNRKFLKERKLGAICQLFCSIICVQKNKYYGA